MEQRKNYYNILEQTQKGSIDITNWMERFLKCLLSAIKSSEKSLGGILSKHALLQKIAGYKLNARQRKIINMLFDDFRGNLTSSKWAKLTKTSQDSANRDITDLVNMKILKKAGDERSTHYVLYSAEKENYK